MKQILKAEILGNFKLMSKKHNDWILEWSDEFEGKTLNSKNWNRQIEKAGRFNEEWQSYTNSDENAYIEDGKLVIKAIHLSDRHGYNQYTSARLNTANKQSFKYGKISARIKLPETKGIWPAFWMLGTNIDENGGNTPWPFCGEIDILELYGSRDDGAVEANLHYASEKGEHAQMGEVVYKLKSGKFSEDFHVFDLIWDKTKILWLVDNEVYAKLDITAKEYSVFHQSFFLLLNIAVGGTFSGRPDDTSKFPQYMYVDWIRIYRKS